MIELRWLIRSLSDSSEKILQYRQQYDSTIYAGMGQFPESAKQIVWSEWKDVPEVKS